MGFWVFRRDRETQKPLDPLYCDVKTEEEARLMALRDAVEIEFIDRAFESVRPERMPPAGPAPERKVSQPEIQTEPAFQRRARVMAPANAQHLKILSILHYIFGAWTAFTGCFASIYIGLGLMIVRDSTSFAGGKGGPPPESLGWIFMTMGTAFMIGFWVIGFCIMLAGRFLARRTQYVFCIIIAALICLSVPLGTILGVFTLIVLLRPEVKETFGPRVPREAIAAR